MSLAVMLPQGYRPRCDYFTVRLTLKGKYIIYLVYLTLSQFMKDGILLADLQSRI